MQKGISIIYANRDRDVKRIKASLDSLQRQTETDFEVVFVDYGSEPALVEEYRELLNPYNFASFYPLEVSHLLWNKSKALNYGIKKATFPYIFIADVDLIFHPEALLLFKRLAVDDAFFLFPLGYLSKNESNKIYFDYEFFKLKPQNFGKVNGMILVAKAALLKVNGLDEFFHFYGAEDEDLFARLENAGFKKEKVDKKFFLHNWHRSFSGSEDKLLSWNPRIKNIMRINQRHFLENKRRMIIKPFRQAGMAELVESHRDHFLRNPDLFLKIANIQAHVEHLLQEELPQYVGNVISVKIYEDPYSSSFKHWLKRKLGKQTQPYISMKEVNDMLLKEILFRYRDYNYSFRVGEDRKTIEFCIQM